MADQLPNIRISSTGGTENPESFLSNNHLELDRMTARENKLRSRAPTEGSLAFRCISPSPTNGGVRYSTRLNLANLGPAARLTTNGKSFPNKLVRNVSKDVTTNPQRLDGRKDSQQHIDPLSQVSLARKQHLFPL